MSQTTLHSLVNNGSNYKKSGDEIYKHSLEQDRKYRQYLNQLHNIKTKLNLFFDEIDNQIVRVSKLLENVIYQYEMLIKQIEKEHGEQSSLLQGLIKSLENLRSTELHALLQEKTQKSNLHDFVNVSQVRDILEKGKNRVQEHQNLIDFGKSSLKEMTTPQDEVNTKCKSLRSSLKEMLLQCPSNRDLNRPLLTSLTDELDKIRRFKELVTRLGRKVPLPDLESMPVEEDKIIQSKTLPGMNDTYLKIEKNTLIARATVHKLKEYWNGGKWCAKELENLSQMLSQQKREDLERLKRAFIKLRMDDLLFEEIRELTSWYTTFPYAYQMCLVEIVRRSDIHRATQKRILEMREEMNKLFKDEEERRHQFVNDFGKYLPMNLLPELLEPTPRYTIPQNFKLNIPNIQLTEEQILDIKRRCCNRNNENIVSNNNNNNNNNDSNQNDNNNNTNRNDENSNNGKEKDNDEDEKKQEK